MSEGEANSSTNIHLPVELNGGNDARVTVSHFGAESASGSAIPSAKQENADKRIASFFFQNYIPFSAAQSASYQDMVDVIGECGVGYKAPSSETLRSSIVESVKSDVQDHYSKMMSEWKGNGCAILCDSWTDGEGRTLLAFSVACSKGVFFLKSMDVSDHAEDPHYLFRLIEEVVLEVGIKNVVQVITESRKCYEYAGKLLVKRYPSLFWSPCALHCICQILEDFSQQDWVHRVLEEANMITSFVYGNGWVLNFMKSKFTGGAELKRPRVAGCASIFLSLRSIVEKEVNLKRMICHLDWQSVSLHARESEAQSMVSVLYQVGFWKSAREAVCVTEPLIRVLRLVDGDMPAMGYIYDAMENAKLKIKAYYENAEEKYERIREIIDKRWCIHLLPLAGSAAFLNPSVLFTPIIKVDPMMSNGYHAAVRKMAKEHRKEISIEQSVYLYAEGAFGNESAIKGRALDSPGHWWAAYGHEIPALQKVAIRILGQPCSSYGRLWVWKAIEKIHYRGQLRGHHPDDELMKDLVYLQCNLLLQAVEKRKDGTQSRRAVHIEEVDLNCEWPSESEVSVPLLDVALFDS